MEPSKADKINFIPDYKAWWNKKDLTEDDLSWLVLGITPDDARQAIAKKDQGQISGINEDGFMMEFSNYADTLPHGAFLGNTRKGILSSNLWGKGKRDFIKNLYEQMPIFKLPEDFYLYLCANNIIPKHFDHYKDHSQYQADLAKWNLKDITDEDTALALLTGLTPEAFIRLYPLVQSISDGKKWVDFEPDDKHFFHQCALFLKKEYPHLDMYPETWLMNFCYAAKDMSLWKNDFSAYIQALHDEGFIFRKETYEGLKHHKIMPSYSKDSWAIQFYERWLKESLWTLKEALHLFKGDDPRQGKWRSYHSIGQNTALYSFGKDTFLAWDMFDSSFFHLDQRLKRHITAGQIKSMPPNGWKETVQPLAKPDDMLPDGPYMQDMGEVYFKPQDIVKWLLEHVSYTPPEALLITTLEKADYQQYLKGETERQKTQSLSSTEHSASQWMDTQIEKGINHGKKENWQSALQKLIPALSARGFERVWGNKATPEMKAAGRRASRDIF
jgi:hypothetical protein